MPEPLNAIGLFVHDPHMGWVLQCPICGYEYTHLQRAYALEGSDPAEPESQSIAGELYGVAAGGIVNWRRGALVLEFECEAGEHLFSIRFQQHKGYTFVIPEVVPE